MSKIALNFIFKGNERPEQIYRMLNSSAPYVDAIYATATWEKEGEAVNVVKNFGGKVSFFKWVKDFSRARNFALQQVPDEYEYVLWLDADDELVGGNNIKKLLEQKFDAYFATYNYDIDPDTKEVLTQHPRERIFKKKIYKWIAPLHETAIAQGKVETTFSKEFAVNHYPDKKDEQTVMQRNLEILEETYNKQGKNKDARIEYYLGRQYYDMRKWPEAEKIFVDYLKHSGWDEERAMAYNYLAEIYREVGKIDDAIFCLMQAIQEYPYFPTFFINLGVAYGKKENWDRALFYTKLGLGMEMPKTAMVLNPRDDKIRALETIYFATFNKRLLKEAFAAAEKLLQFFPKDETLRQRARAMYDLNRWTEMSKMVADIVKELSDLKENDKIEPFLNSLPTPIADNAYLERIRNKFLKPKQWPKKSIVYYCGKGFEKWDESNLKKGIGGSETAVIHLAKWWRKQGYEVTVYGDPHNEHKDKNGVEWKPYWKFNFHDTFDTLIIWRNETVLNAPLKARQILLDLHDVPNQADYTEERLAKIDKIFVKSAYHRSLLPKVPDDKFIIIPNGIDLDILKGLDKIKKNKNKLIYSSSYDRGIDMMLEYGWPIIKKALPKAELHIYYGWNLFDTLYKDNPERMAWKKKILKLMSQPGVFEHGRIAQKDLLKAKAESIIHYYGCTFEEIDCIGVRESAAVKCLPMTTDYAALKGRTYVQQTAGNPFLPETHKNLAKNIVREIKKPMTNIKNYQNYALQESWQNISKVWLKEIKN